MPESNQNQYSKRFSSFLTGISERIGVIRWLMGSIVKLSMSVRECGGRVSGLVLMNSAFFGISDGFTTVLIENASSLLSSDRDQSSKDDSVVDLLTNSLILERIKLLKTYNSQLSLRLNEVYSSNDVMVATNILNLTTEIIQENWDIFPDAIKEKLKKKLSVVKFRKSFFGITFAFIKLVNFSNFRRTAQLLSWAVRVANEPAERKLLDDFFEAFNKIRNLEVEISKHGRPISSEGFKTSDEIHTETLQWLESLPVTDDRWLDSCPEVKSSFEKGLAQAKSGRVVRRSFVDMEFDD